MSARRHGARRRAGFTLLESVVAIAIFSVLGYALTIAADMGNSSQREVVRVAEESRALREATTSIARELRSTSDANVLIAALPDGNHRVRFMMPIVVGGVELWGVYDRALGTTAAAQSRADWFVQYTVRDQVLGTGAVNKQLLRQVLDDALVVQREVVLAGGLKSGADDPPGFQVVMNGAMWEVTLSTDGPFDGNLGKSTVFHVKTRN